MKILSNKKYEEICGAIREYSNQINDLKENYNNLREAYDILGEGLVARDNRIFNLKSMVDELKAENKSLKSSKGGYTRVINKLKKDLEETQKKLEESMTNKYLVKKVPMGKLPKGQVMKMKSHAKQDKIIQKVYEKMENDEI